MATFINPSSESAPEKPVENSSGWLYLLAAAIGTVAIIALFFISGNHDVDKQQPLSIAHSPVAQQVNEPVAVVAEPEVMASEPLLIEPEAAPAEAALVEPETVRPAANHIIPADHSGPPWALNLQSFSNPDSAPEHLEDIIALGFTPEVAEVMIDGRHWSRVRIKGFATVPAARKAGRHFVGNKEYRTLWIGGY